VIQKQEFFVHFHSTATLYPRLLGGVNMQSFIGWHNMLSSSLLWVFTRESSYCFQRVSQFRLSVCLSHGWISQKRCKIGSPNLHRRLPGRL